MTQLFNNMAHEKLAKENEDVRKLLSEFNQFGLNDRMRWVMIYLLGLELTNVEEMQTVAAFVKDMRPDATSLSAALEKLSIEQ